MAQNRNSHRKSRVTQRQAPEPAPRRRTQRDRRLFWIRVVSAVLVLAMLLSVLAGVLSLA